MWSDNTFTRRLNLRWPILQAPMGELTTPSLAGAVSDAGAMGGLGMWGFSAQDAERRIAGFRQLSGGSLNVNYPLWSDPGDLSGAAMAMRAKVQTLYDEKGLGPDSHTACASGRGNTSTLRDVGANETGGG